MRYPSIEVLHGKWNEDAEFSTSSRLMGYGRPEKDLKTKYLGRPATKFQGDVGVLLDPGIFKMGYNTWTLQFHGMLTGNLVFMASADYPKVANEFQIAIVGSALNFYSVGAGLFAQVYIPKEFRGGFRHYALVCNGSRVDLHIDGSVIGGVTWVPQAPSNQIMLLGGQYGRGQTLGAASECYCELLRLDIGFVMRPNERIRFAAEKTLDVAWSFVGVEKPSLGDFGLTYVKEIISEAPPLVITDATSANGVIPTFVGAAGPTGFTAVADSRWDSSFSEWKAFAATHNLNNCWVSNSPRPTTASPRWIGIVSTDWMVFNGFTMEDRLGGIARAWVFGLYGKNETTGQWELIRRCDETEPNRMYHKRVFVDFGMKVYKEVRLIIESTDPSRTENYAALGKLQLHRITGKPSKKQVKFSDGSVEFIDLEVNTQIGPLIKSTSITSQVLTLVPTTGANIVATGTVVNVDPGWNYPTGNGYLTGGATPSFVPVVVTGCNFTEETNRYLISDPESTPPDVVTVNEYGTGVMTATSGATTVVPSTAATWTTIPLTCYVDGVLQNAGAGTLPLPAGSYYGELRLSHCNNGAALARVINSANGVLFNSPGTLNNSANGSACRFWCQLANDDTMRVQIFGERTATNFVTFPAQLQGTVVTAELNLFRVM